MSPALPLLLVLAILIIIAANLFLGRRRYVGIEPHCRKCDYLLLGLESSRCPECGSHLSPSSIVFGQRTRRWKPFIAGWLLIAVFGSLLLIGAISALNDVDWYHYEPTYFVLKDAGSSNLTDAHRAWIELIRRDTAGALSSRNRDRLVRLALNDQQNANTPFSKVDTDAINYLSSRILAGDLPPDQQKRIFDQALWTRVEVRPQVIAGDQVPYMLLHEGLGPSGPSLWMKITMAGAALDGKLIPGNTGGSSSSSGFVGGSMGSSIQSPSPGMHTLTLKFRVEAFHSPFDVPSTPLYQSDRSFTNDFEVLSSQPVDFVKPFIDPNLVQAVKSAIVPGTFRYIRSQKSLDGDLNIRNSPADLAFDVFAIWGGISHSISQITFNHATGSCNYAVNGNMPSPPPPHIDLLLRPSAKAARQTVDLTSYWNGEIRYENVPVQITP